ncbi:Carbohydrate-binding protein [Phytophthora cinnamomi]|uniref:Carbohydrate-binding protein n=1 Tax=Phytophthora cinnamomi TaxID=4785 RepID=UPI0035593CE2|nr:Carbohydrate-binding protein [Phytophthora cinnamomi]
MKFAALIIACLLHAVAATSTSSCGPRCLEPRQYCDSSISECRAADPGSTECYNATASVFQDGCALGFTCLDSLCRSASEAGDVDGRTCSIICAAGKFCENDTVECRGPANEYQCFNLSTGFFQDGCADGYFCTFNKCVDVSASI